MKNLMIDRIVHLVVMRDFMIYQKGLELRADYYKRVGQYELANFKLNMAADKLEYRLNLIKENYREGITPDPDEMDEEIQQEFSYHQEILQEMIKNMLLVKGYEQLPEFSREAKSELVRSYGVLARRFYPELYPKDENKKAIWEKILLAYQHWNLESLLNTELESVDVDTEVPLEFHELARLEELIEEEVNLLLQDFPFNLKELLEDEEGLSAHVDEIREQTAMAEERIHAMKIDAYMLLDPVNKVVS